MEDDRIHHLHQMSYQLACIGAGEVVVEGVSFVVVVEVVVVACHGMKVVAATVVGEVYDVVVAAGAVQREAT